MTTPATTPLTYNGYVTQVATLGVVEITTAGGVVVGNDDWFNLIIPQMLNYAELRIQRDVDLLALQTSNASYALTSGSNQLSISTNDFVTLQTITINGTPLTPVGKEWLQTVYPTGFSTTGTPQYFAMLGGDAATAGNTSILVRFGPPPDSAYALTIFGSVRMPTLYQYANATDAGTQTTFISTWLPDLLVMASMIYLSAYQRNFGRIADDPQMAVTYESQYGTLLRGAQVEEARKRFAASGWSSMPTSPAATQGR